MNPGCAVIAFGSVAIATVLRAGIDVILHEQIPAIALTEYVSERDQSRAIESGFQMHLGKPVDRVN
jgi:CheY-like chemotaxis protein